MPLLYKLLSFLQGKKSMTFSILFLTNTFLLTRGVIDQSAAEYIAGVLTILAGGANYGTYKMNKKNGKSS